MPDLITSPAAPAEAAPVAPAPDAGPQAPQQPAFVDPQPLVLPPEDGPAPPPADEPFLAVETGTIYRTREAAAAGIVEKDRYINELKQNMAEMRQQQAELMRAMQQNRQPVQQGPQVDPYESRFQEAYQVFVDQMGLPEKEAKVMAAREVATIREAEQRAAQVSQQFLRQTYAQQFEQIRSTDPSFDVEQNEMVRTIFAAHGDKGPQYCYDLYKRWSGQATTSAAPMQAPSLAPQVAQAQQAFASQRASQLDGLPSQPAALSPYQNLPREVHEAAQRGIMERPSRANDPAWKRENYQLAINMWNKQRGLTQQGGYR